MKVRQFTIQIVANEALDDLSGNPQFSGTAAIRDETGKIIANEYVCKYSWQEVYKSLCTVIAARLRQKGEIK